MDQRSLNELRTRMPGGIVADVIVPDGMFKSNAVRSDLVVSSWILTGILVALSVFVVVPSLSSPTWVTYILVGWIPMRIENHVRRVTIAWKQKRLKKNTPGNWCFCYFGVPNGNYTSQKTILVRAEFGGGVRIVGKGVDYSIRSHRILAVEEQDCLIQTTPKRCLRIDWTAESGGVNSLFLSEFDDWKPLLVENWKMKILAFGELDEKLPPDVSWLPVKEFKFTPLVTVLCAGTVLLTILVLEYLHYAYTLFSSSGSHFFWLFFASLIAFAMVFGFFITRHNDAALKKAKNPTRMHG